MNIQHLSCHLRNLITKREQEKRKQRLGIAPLTPVHVSNNMSHLIRMNLIEPIVKDLCSTTGENITYQAGLSTGFYKLLVNAKPFTIIYMPNPSTGKVFIYFLNHNEKQCSLSRPLYDTCQIIDYLKVYNNSCYE